MTEPTSCSYNVITVYLDHCHLPNTPGFAVVAERAASARATSIVSAQMTRQTISVVTVQAPIGPQHVAHADWLHRRPSPYHLGA